MPYSKTTWTNDAGAALNATNLNKIENGIETGVTHSEVPHAPADADNTAANETSHADVVVDGDIGITVQAHDIVLDNTTASYTAAEETKLAGIEDNSTADQTGSEIAALYEALANTNKFEDLEKTKLAQAPISDPTGVTGADQITNMMSLTQAEYDAIDTPDVSTFYLIVG